MMMMMIHRVENGRRGLERKYGTAIRKSVASLGDYGHESGHILVR